MKPVLFTLFTVFSLFSFGQNIHFIKSYGNNGYDFGRDIKQDLDTGYIATGSSSSFYSGNADAFLLKVDSLGTFQWSYNYGGSGSDWGESVLVNTNGGYSIAGYTNSFGAGGFDFFFVKTDAAGVPEYQKTYGGSDWDKAYDMVQLPDDGYIIVGETFSFGSGNNDIYIVRIDDLGDTLWTDVYGGAEADYANAVLLDGDSIVVVGGTKSFGNGMTDGIILKYHIDGTLGWVKTAGMERDDYFTCITSNNSGEYFLGGTRNYFFDQTGYLGDIWVYNMEDSGNLIADTTQSGGSHELEIAYGIAVDNNDNIFFGGSTKSFGYSLIDGETDAYVGKFLNTYYQANYINNFGVAGKEVITQFRNTNDQGYVAIGDIKSKSTGGNDIFILKIDKSNSIGIIEIDDDLESGNNITLSISPEEPSVAVSVYPTLARETITIEGLDVHFSLKVFDLSGKEQLTLNNEPNVDISFLESGYYLIQIQTSRGFYATKFYKQH